MAEADFKAQVVAVAATARPGDTVLIGFTDRLSDEELSYLDEQFQEYSERTGIEFALVSGVCSMIVVRDDRDAASSEGDED